MMDPQPCASCFTFDCLSGNFYESFAEPWRIWIPYNPNYDPGPPPPKPLKQPKAPKAKKQRRTAHSNEFTPESVETDEETMILEKMQSLDLTSDGALEAVIETHLVLHSDNLGDAASSCDSASASN